LVVLSEGAEWEDHKTHEYGEPDAYGHRKKASVAESLADEIKRRAGQEAIASDLTYDLRSGDPDFIDKLVALTFGNMACDAILDGKSGLMSGLVQGCYECQFRILSSARAKWTSPPCTTPNSTVPFTRTSAACRSF
jgi:6-phosphofructokinase